PIVTSKTPQIKLHTFIEIIHLLYQNLQQPQQLIPTFIKIPQNQFNIPKSFLYSHPTAHYQLIPHFLKIHTPNPHLNKYLR
ncbi:hypothetical protein, partial [Bacillus thuringiensis]|uniref:hypothetical protein n=1 Tax=Bacillus thuringiensis TaxID=1428 RepID=UPI001C92E50A